MGWGAKYSTNKQEDERKRASERGTRRKVSSDQDHQHTVVTVKWRRTTLIRSKIVQQAENDDNNNKEKRSPIHTTLSKWTGKQERLWIVNDDLSPFFCLMSKRSFNVNLLLKQVNVYWHICFFYYFPSYAPCCPLLDDYSHSVPFVNVSIDLGYGMQKSDSASAQQLERRMTHEGERFANIVITSIKRSTSIVLFRATRI